MKNKKLIINLILITFISFLGVFGVGGNTSAQIPGVDEEGLIDTMIGKLQQAILGALAKTISGFVEFLGNALAWIARVAARLAKYSEFTKEGIVTTGWGIMRDFANMFFVVILLVIAFATILRLETYGMKQTLWRLIVAALLINFSLVIVAPILDFTNILTLFFIESMEEGRGDFTATLADAFRLTKSIRTTFKTCKKWDCGSATDMAAFNYGECTVKCNEVIQPPKINLPSNVNIQPIYVTNASCMSGCEMQWCPCAQWVESEATDEDKIAWAGTGSFGGDIKMTINVIFGLLATALFVGIALFSFGVFMLMLVARIVIIWFLLILAPGVWLCWILPFTRNHFRTWWTNFIKWAMFAPLYMFFIWLAITSYAGMIATAVDEVTVSEEKGRNVEQLSSVGATAPDVFKPTNLLQFVLVGGVLVGGLIAAQSLGGAGADIVLSNAKKAGKWGAGKAGKYTGYEQWQRERAARKSATEAEKKEAAESKVQYRSQKRAEKRYEKGKMSEAEELKYREDLNKRAERLEKTYKPEEIKRLAESKGPQQAAAIRAQQRAQEKENRETKDRERRIAERREAAGGGELKSSIDQLTEAIRQQRNP